MPNADPETIPQNDDRSVATAHTRGPWFAEMHPENEAERAAGRDSWTCVYIGEESDEPPGRVWRTFIEGNITHGPEQGDPEADLRLIAAAPDLLEALKGLEDANNKLAAKRSHGVYLLMEAEAREEMNALDKARQAARKAISKAEGEG